jgi:hypothetical protein
LPGSEACSQRAQDYRSILTTGLFLHIFSKLSLAWKDAPKDVKNFIHELQSLKTSLSELNTNVLLNKDFADAFHGRHWPLLSKLDPLQTTSTLELVTSCRTELEIVLRELEAHDQGRKAGWERLMMIFLSDKSRETVENLHRRCLDLNKLLLVDTAPPPG